MDFSQKLNSVGFFFFVFLVVVLSWILVDLWGRWFNNFTFNYLKLNEHSSYQTFVIALAATIVIVSAIDLLKTFNVDYQKNVYLICDDEENIEEVFGTQAKLASLSTFETF